MQDHLLYKNYRVPSTRWRGWNYGWNGWYFVTMCTKDRVCYFGDVVEKKMILSNVGKIAQDCWIRIPQHFPFARIDEFVVMPNHVHGIIEIDKGEAGLAHNHNRRDEACLVSTNISPAPGSVSAIIGGFKSACTKIIHQQCPHIDFAWQSRFHDHIIRDEFELGRIRKYILENPETWDEDELYVA